MPKNWVASDLQQLLAVIDRRLATAALLNRLSCNPRVHETALHELMARSLWMFGIEEGEGEVCSNTTLQTAVRRLFGRTWANRANAQQRPDLVIGPGGLRYRFAHLRYPHLGVRARHTPHPDGAGVETRGSRLTPQANANRRLCAGVGRRRRTRQSTGFIHAWVVGDDSHRGCRRIACSATTIDAMRAFEPPPTARSAMGRADSGRVMPATIQSRYAANDHGGSGRTHLCVALVGRWPLPHSGHLVSAHRDRGLLVCRKTQLVGLR